MCFQDIDPLLTLLAIDTRFFSDAQLNPLDTLALSLKILCKKIKDLVKG